MAFSTAKTFTTTEVVTSKIKKICALLNGPSTKDELGQARCALIANLEARPFGTNLYMRFFNAFGADHLMNSGLMKDFRFSGDEQWASVLNTLRIDTDSAMRVPAFSAFAKEFYTTFPSLSKERVAGLFFSMFALHLVTTSAVEKERRETKLAFLGQLFPLAKSREEQEKILTFTENYVYAHFSHQGASFKEGDDVTAFYESVCDTLQGFLGQMTLATLSPTLPQIPLPQTPLPQIPLDIATTVAATTTTTTTTTASLVDMPAPQPRPVRKAQVPTTTAAYGARALECEDVIQEFSRFCGFRALLDRDKVAALLFGTYVLTPGVKDPFFDYLCAHAKITDWEKKKMNEFKDKWKKLSFQCWTTLCTALPKKDALNTTFINTFSTAVPLLERASVCAPFAAFMCQQPNYKQLLLLELEGSAAPKTRVAVRNFHENVPTEFVGDAFRAQIQATY